MKGNTFRGTVTVSGAPPADTLYLAVKPQLIVYGGRVTLAGTLSNQKVGENVDVLAEPCGQTAATTRCRRRRGGAFTAVVQPLTNTVYTVKVKNTTSPTLAVTVRRSARVVSRREADCVRGVQPPPSDEPYGFGIPEIYVVNVDGTGLRRLTKDREAYDLAPTWTPDGRIVFASYRGGPVFYVMNRDGTGVRRFVIEREREGH